MMTEFYKLGTKFIPWKRLDQFNQIAGCHVSRYESSPTRPGLLNREFRELVADNNKSYLVFVEADTNEVNTGFYVVMMYEPQVKDKAAIKHTSRKLRRAVYETTGRRIRKQLISSE